MPGAFPYRPKFVDIRVRPPKAGEDDAPPPGLKPGERPCDHVGCLSPATARAPKSRERMDEHYWFCAPHAAEYNKAWNYFAGMDDDAVAAFREDEAQTGGRPTWRMQAGRFSREAAAFAAKFGSGVAGKGAGAYADAFDLFGRGGASPKRAAEASGRKLGNLERKALVELDLDGEADGAAIRARYLDLVKRFHPDSNGGDRSAEDKLTRVIRAYKTLQKAKLTT
jgi:hypothetical protein